MKLEAEGVEVQLEVPGQSVHVQNVDLFPVVVVDFDRKTSTLLSISCEISMSDNAWPALSD